MPVYNNTTVVYNNRTLTQTGGKQGGKNKNNSCNGYYIENDSENPKKYFIKKPTDKLELYTELFAAFVLDELIKAGYVDSAYINSLIYADLITFEDGSKGLIQPSIEFEPLFKLAGTGNYNNTDRSPLKEMWSGQRAFPAAINKLDNHVGLSSSLFHSLLLGDYSTHGSNVVLREGGQFARIDWGAAFRNYCYKQNNVDILHPYEYQGAFNLKKQTKGYILNFKGIDGLYERIGEHAQNLLEKLDQKTLHSLIQKAYQRIPADLLTPEEYNRLAKYIGVKSVTSPVFVDEITSTMYLRLNNIAKLNNTNTAQKRSNPYRSGVFGPVPGATTLTNDRNNSFQQVIFEWSLVMRIDGNCSLNKVDTELLVTQYNQYVQFMESLLDSFPQKTGRLLAQAFLLNPSVNSRASELNLNAFDPVTVSAAHLLKTGKEIIELIQKIKREQSQELFEEFKKKVNEFNNESDTMLEKISASEVPDNEESPDLSLIRDESLKRASAKELANMCLKEWHAAGEASPLLARIVVNDEYWDKLVQGFKQIKDGLKITGSLFQLRDRLLQNQLQHEFYAQLDNFNNLDDSDAAEAFKALDEIYGRISPRSSQLNARWTEAKDRVDEINRLKNIAAEKNHKTNRYSTGDEKRAAVEKLFENLEQAKTIHEYCENYRELSVKNIPEFQQRLTGFCDITTLILRGIIEDTEALDKVQKTWSLVTPFPELKKVITGDKFLWQTISACHKTSLSQMVVNDLLVIKNFHDSKIEFARTYNREAEYTNAVHEFYREALAIRLSQETPVRQIELFREKAKSTMPHRDFKARLFADLLNIFLAIPGLVRAAILKKTFFALSSPTKRDKEFSNLLGTEVNEQDNDSVSLFKPPT
ncbi:LepB GTPase-activating domain-containing protein [Legionella dresdenensis]|uniref:LepB GTPase-activating domain-containing protein n=1 Tax=Legionella dresdenensis TaxID=450200 RepID=A0ABV8CH52_9GAMM